MRNIKGHYVLDNPYKDLGVRAGLAVSKLIAKQKAGVVIVSNIGEISFYILRESLIDIYKVQGDTAKESVNRFISKDLEEIAKPTTKD